MRPNSSLKNSVVWAVVVSVILGDLSGSIDSEGHRPLWQGLTTASDRMEDEQDW